MATSKISNLNTLAPLNSNTANVYFVATDKQTGVSGKVSGTTLANGLYAYNTLNVGNNAVIFPGVIAQLVGNNTNYLQVNLQNGNANGSADYVITGDTGTDTINYLDLGLQNSNSNSGILFPNDGYLYIQGNTSTTPGGNLIVATTTQNRDIIFAQGGYSASNVVARFSYNSGLHLTQKPITFADGTTQNTSFAGAAVAANTPSNVANSAAIYANGAFTQANAAFNSANTSLQNTSTITINSNLIVPGTLNVGGQILPTTTGLSIGSAIKPFQDIYLSNSAATFSNTNLTLSGSFHVLDTTGQNNTFYVSNTGYTTLKGSYPIPGQAIMNISGQNSLNVVPLVSSVIGGVLHLTGANVGPTLMTIDNFDTATPTTAGNAIVYRRFRGNVDYPTPVQTNDRLGSIAAAGYGSSSSTYTSAGLPGTSQNWILWRAIENYSNTAQGAQMEINLVPVGSNVAQTVLTLSTNTATFTSNVVTNVVTANTGNIGTITISNNNIYSSNTSTDINFGQLTASANINFNRISVFNKQINANAGIILNDAGLYQYNTSNNSTVTQLTDKSTAVTCNGRTGQITTSNASLASNRSVSFTVNNNQIVSAKDVVIVNIASGATTATYSVCVTSVNAAGSFVITISNNSGSAAADTLVINFAIIRVQ